MPHILMAANKRETLETLARALKAESTVTLEWTHDRARALARIADRRPDLVVVDEYVGYLTNLEFIRQIIDVDASARTAAVSRLPRRAFREVAEGLGVLAQLPPRPGVLDAERLLALLETLAPAPRT